MKPFEILDKYSIENNGLIEFLQLFLNEVKRESTKRKTLVYFRTGDLEQETVDILNQIQKEKNVNVVLVLSSNSNTVSKNGFPRHLTIYHFYPRQNKAYLKKLVDLIRNTNFNRFEFDKHLSSVKDRVCLKNIKIIIVALDLNMLEEFVIEFFISTIKDNIDEIPDIKLLIDSASYFEKDLHMAYDYELDYRETSFTQINKTVVLKGTGPKYSSSWNQKINLRE